jgi:AraC-like DNA-binding protein
MPSVEQVIVPGRYRLFDHQHHSDHVLVVLSGEIVEDGVMYRAGDVRLSSAADRHFLTFTAPTTCFVLDGRVPRIACGSRRIVHLGADFMNGLADRGPVPLDDRIASLVESALVRDVAARDVPPWLAEFEDVRLAGGMVNARNIDVAARMAGVSREHLARSYRRHFGNSVTGGIKARRLHTAWDAVTRSHMALADIAGASGFADQSHMTRHFVEWIGLTPAGARRAAREVTRLQDGTLALAL